MTAQEGRAAGDTVDNGDEGHDHVAHKSTHFTMSYVEKTSGRRTSMSRFFSIETADQQGRTSRPGRPGCRTEPKDDSEVFSRNVSDVT